MNTKIILGIIVGVVVVGGGVLLITGGKSNGNGIQVASACADVCQKAHEACPSLINQDDCNSKCAKLTAETKEHLRESTSCEQLTSRPNLIADLLIPEVATPTPVDKTTNDCEAACGHYVISCLTLVPNATQALFDDGYNSCLSECSRWSGQKVDCMIKAFDCEAMTDVCGL